MKARPVKCLAQQEDMHAYIAVLNPNLGGENVLLVIVVKEWIVHFADIYEDTLGGHFGKRVAAREARNVWKLWHILSWRMEEMSLK